MAKNEAIENKINFSCLDGKVTNNQTNKIHYKINYFSNKRNNHEMIFYFSQTKTTMKYLFFRPNKNNHEIFIFFQPNKNNK